MILIVDDYLFLTGGIIAALWGLAHLFPTRNIIKMFGNISEENKRILAMSWIVEGVALIFIGAVVCLTVAIAGTENDATRVVTWSAAAAMLTLASINLIAGFRVSRASLKLSALIDGLAGTLFLIGSIINT